MNKNTGNKNLEEDSRRNSDRQDIDKAPGEERGKKEKTTPPDLKAKKIDADLSKKEERSG